MSTKEEARCANTGPSATEHRVATQKPDTLCSEYHNGAFVNISRRYRIVPACILGFVAFAICYLVGQVAAAITGWHALVYIGFGIGVWLFASSLVAFCMSGTVRRG